MGIMHLIHTPRHSGAESVVRDLCLLHGAKGHACAIAAFAPAAPTYAGDVERMTHGGIRLYLPPDTLRGVGRVRQFSAAISDFRPDVIFAHSVLPSLYGRLALPLFRSRPRFFTVLHGATTDDFADPYLQRLEHVLRWRTDAMIAVSQLGADNYRRRFNPSTPIFVVPNGIDLTGVRNGDRARCRADFGLGETDRMVLQVGRISPVKQQHFTVHALRSELRAGQMVLWFAGLKEDAGYQRELEEMVRAKGLTDAVRFLGSRADIPELLAACDLYVMPSMHEAHSIALLEALASGPGVVASTIAAFQFCADWPGVRLVAPDDEAAFREACAAQIGKGPFDRDMSAFTIERTAQTYLDIATGHV